MISFFFIENVLNIRLKYEAVKTLLERNGVMVTIPPRSSNSERRDLIQDLNKLLHFAKGQQEDSAGLPELQLIIAMEALRCAIKYLDLINDAANLGHYHIKQLNLKRYGRQF